MILANGFSIVSKLFETRSSVNPFFQKKLLCKGDVLFKAYRYLLAAANIADYRGLPRGWLAFTYRELATHLRVSTRTALNYVKRLILLGFFRLHTKVNKNRSEQTTIEIVGYPPRRAQGKQASPAPSYIEERENKNKTPLIPSKGRGERFSPRDRDLARLRRAAVRIVKTLGSTEAIEKGEDFQAIENMLRPKDAIVLREHFGSAESYYRFWSRTEKAYKGRIYDRTGFLIVKVRERLAENLERARAA